MNSMKTFNVPGMAGRDRKRRKDAIVGDPQHWQYGTFKAPWRVCTIEDLFVTFSLNQDGSIDSAKMVAVSPLADFSFDYQTCC
jgi:hypothetical protein